MQFSRTNKWLGAGMIAASLGVLLRRTWLMELDAFEFDDAYMFCRYAGNILEGYGYTWNPGDPPVFGSTSILYTYVIAAVKGILGNADNSLLLTGTALFFAWVLLLVLIEGIRNNMRSQLLRNRPVLYVLLLPILVLPLIFGFQVSSGMETMCSTLLNAIFIFAILRYGQVPANHAKWWTAAGVTALLCWEIRPDNAIVIAFFPLLYFLFRRQRGHLWRFTLIASLLVGLDLVARYAVFGEILPLAFYAKKSSFTEGYTARYFWNPVRYFMDITAYMTPFILVMIFLARKVHRGLLTGFLLPVAGTFACLLGFDQIMGFHARFYFPFIPFIIVPAMLVADDHLNARHGVRSAAFEFNRIFGRVILLLVFLTLTVYSRYRFINMYEHYAIARGNRDAIPVPLLKDRKYDREESIVRINRLLQQFPDDLVMAATEHGFLSSANPGKRILDLSGLHQPDIAHHGYHDAILEQEQPDLIWMPHHDLTVLHYKVRTGPFFEAHYQYISDVYAFGCAVRKDSPYYEGILKAMYGP